ncbi:translation initiation factor eIF-2 beta subunit [Rhizina undulata]
MTDTEEAPTFDPSALKKKKSKKSVAFSGEDAENGAGENSAGEDVASGEKTTAESHSLDAGEEDKDVAEVTEMFKGLRKKKKSSKSKSSEAAEGEEVPVVDAEFDPAALKKKKKKSLKDKDAPADSFDAALAEAGIIPTGEGEQAAPAEATPEDTGDLLLGTGVWHSTSTTDLTYPLLLSRFFILLRTQHPDLAGDGRSKSYKIPPPQVLREGNKKTIFANLNDICKRMKRHDDHVTQFLFAELGTSGSVDGSKRLVIRGKFQQKQLENVLRRYILEYVTCRTCKSPDTELKKGENRLFFVTCNSCGSRRSVAAIKTGFQATVGKRRRAQA